MKVAVVYNRNSQSVINLFGVPNRERYGLKSIKRIVDALKAGEHQVIALEGDKDLIDRLEEFMPRALKGERPGMVFNLSYGIQGQARYTHVPGILEMVGIPYVGSGPLPHSLALDKVVAKMLFRQHGLPTPDFAVLQDSKFPLPDLPFPLIVKPKNEAVSFGLSIVNDEKELRSASEVIFEKFQQPVLVERFIEGREINVGLLGNNPPEALPPVELIFGEGGPPIYTYEDKVHRSNREVKPVCPAPIGDEMTRKAKELAIRAFQVLGCYDCARVDFRMDAQGNLYILEVNSLPSLGEHGSYVAAAAAAGLDFAALVNRLVQVASARYFGTPNPPSINGRGADPTDLVFSFLAEQRDRIERRLEDWVRISSRTSDPVGIRAAVQEVDSTLREIRMVPVKEFTDARSAWCWETQAGMRGGTLFLAHVDVPLDPSLPMQGFRRDPEWLYGDGIGCSRAPLVMLEFALRSLRHQRRLRHQHLGVLCVSDEGRDCRYSAQFIRAAAEAVKQVFVLRPGNPADRVITQRRGQRKFRLVAEGKPQRIGKASARSDVFLWWTGRIQEMAALSSRKEHVALSAVDVHTDAFPMYVPHRVTSTVVMTYAEPEQADAVEGRMRDILNGDGFRCDLEMIADRPPMAERKANVPVMEALREVAGRWEIPLEEESSVWPSVAGLVPPGTAVVCGMGPVATELYTPHEAVQRISLPQRTLLLAEMLARDIVK